MTITAVQNLMMFSDEAIEDYIKQAPGKPFINQEGKKIGHITHAERVHETKTIRVTVVIDS